MKNRLNFRFLSAIIIALVLFVSTSSCDKEPKGERPDLPPAEVLFMDYSDFDEDMGMTKGATASHSHFIHAYGTILFWHSPAITVYTALPVAAYTMALAQEAEYMGDNSWRWSYDISWFESNYIVTLTASRVNNEEFSIEMDVALASLPNMGLRWFDGVIRYDHTQATWTIYKEGTIAIVDAEMNKDYETEAGSLKYSYVEPDMDETGSYILYEYAPDEAYDASYSISLSAGLTVIEWITATSEGRVQDQVKFGDTDWHCWDSLENGLVDKSCE